MKILATIAFLLFAVSAIAQTADSTQQANPIYVVDGQIDETANDIKSGDILNTSILNATDAKARYGEKGANGAIVIVTKQYAAKQYQKKLSAFSKKYKNYLELKHNDSKLSYVLDNIIMDVQRKSAVQELYQLAPNNIKSVAFKKDSHFTTDATIVITTKEKPKDQE